MKIVTISRQFGSGGRELGKRLADELGFDYYDREIITSIAQAQGMDEGYVEKALEDHAWQHIPLTYGRSFASGAVMQSTQTSLLVEQKRVLDGIANAGKDLACWRAQILWSKRRRLALLCSCLPPASTPTCRS